MLNVNFFKCGFKNFILFLFNPEFLEIAMVLKPNSPTLEEKNGNGEKGYSSLNVNENEPQFSNVLLIQKVSKEYEINPARGYLY